MKLIEIFCDILSYCLNSKHINRVCASSLAIFENVFYTVIKYPNINLKRDASHSKQPIVYFGTGQIGETGFVFDRILMK